MTRLTRALGVLLGAGLSISLSQATGVAAQATALDSFCATEQPDSVVRCLVRSYADRDLDAYRGLLAPDFRFVMGDEAHTWGSDVEIGVHQRFFADSSLRQLTLSIPDGYQVAPGPEPETWVIRGIAATMALDFDRAGTVKHYEVVSQGIEFSVRRVLEPAAHFVIYRWWQPAAQ